MTDQDIEVERREDGGKGEYLIRHPDSSEPARLTWREQNGARVAEHTFTPPALRGKHLAARLVDALVADAREQGFKIVPACSYVAAKFDAHPEWGDLKGLGSPITDR